MPKIKKQINGPANASATRNDEYYEDFKFAAIGWEINFLKNAMRVTLNLSAEAEHRQA
jgi:hypothetical protein